MGTLKPTNNKDITTLNFGLPSDAARKFVLLPRISDYPISPRRSCDMRRVSSSRDLVAAYSAPCRETVQTSDRSRGTMDYDSCSSLPAMFFEQAERLGDKPFLWAKRDERYQPISWAETARDVRRLALGLRSLGIGRGERIGLVSENRPEWIVADLAIMTAGAITVPAYVTHTIDDYRYVLANSGARAVIVSKPGLSARVLAAANQVDTVHTVIAMERATGQASAVDLLLWNEMLARGAEQADDTAELVATIDPAD